MSDLQRYGLSIAGIPIEISTDRKLALEASFSPFLGDQTYYRYRAVFRQMDRLPEIPEPVLYADITYRCHADGKGGYIRSFYDIPRSPEPYAVAGYDYETGDISVDYLERGAVCVSEMANSFFHLGLEAMMIWENRLCVHAACIRSPLGGILFSGPSGIGKSTQAELWCRYRGSSLINGDRPIVSKEADGFYAWGSPYAGSSRCYRNENCRIAAIVMLKQSSHCAVRRLSPGEAFRKIYSGSTMYTWDENFVARACGLATELAMTVPVFEFSCTPDEMAVDYLEKELQEVVGYE